MFTAVRVAAGDAGDESLWELEGRQSSSSALLRLRLLPGVGSVIESGVRGVLLETIVASLDVSGSSTLGMLRPASQLVVALCE